jgi:hypothetical protein
MCGFDYLADTIISVAVCTRTDRNLPMLWRAPRFARTCSHCGRESHKELCGNGQILTYQIIPTGSGGGP